jgi:gentisate 1,2-dioxygenase
MDLDYIYHYESNIEFDSSKTQRYIQKPVTRSHLLSFMTDYLDKMSTAFKPEKTNVIQPNIYDVLKDYYMQVNAQDFDGEDQDSLLLCEFHKISAVIDL